MQWRLGLHLTGPRADALPRGRLAWPSDGAAFVELARVPLATPRVSRADDLDLLVAEADGPRALSEISEHAHAARVPGVVFADDVSRADLVHAGALAPELVFVTESSPKEAVATAARAIAAIVRRRVYLTLLRHWRDSLHAHERALAAIREGLAPPDTLDSTPVMSPLSTIVDAHVSGVLGLWAPGVTKPERHLEVVSSTLRTLRARSCDALAAASGAAAPSHTEVLIVEDEPPLARGVQRLFSRAFDGAERNVAISTVGSAREAAARIRSRGAPDLLWVDVNLERPDAGIHLVESLRRERVSSILIGKSALGDPNTVRRLVRLGALSVWCGAPPRELAQLAVDAARAADVSRDVQRLEERTHALTQEITPLLERALGAVETRRRVLDARRIVQLLEADVASPLPEGLGEPNTSIATIERRSVETALEVTRGNKTLSAKVLGIDVKTLKRILGRTS